MGVTTEQFDALEPLPYSQARLLLQTGDILLFHSTAIGSFVIETFTESLWSHASIIWQVKDVDRVMLLESVDKMGVRCSRLSNRINGCAPDPRPYNGKLLVLRHKAVPAPIPDATAKAMMGFALDRLGYPYSTQELVDVAERIAAGLLHIAVSGEVASSVAYICSEYVACIYAAVGLELMQDKEGFVAPADISLDPNLELVCAMCPDSP